MASQENRPAAGPSLSGLNPQEIADEMGLQPYQGKQIFRWMHQKKVLDFDRMTDLSKDLRRNLNQRYGRAWLTALDVLRSPSSGTKKVLLRLSGGETVESVLLRHEGRVTLCLSTQAGCPLKCTFCATGQSGFARNLTTAEIVEQALHLLADEDFGERTPNVVLMGMGEPFRNYDAAMKGIRLLMDADGLGIGARKIAVSTAGEVPGIERFAQEGWQVRLSVSLHAANDALRNELVPLNRRYSLERVIEAVAFYRTATQRQVTFEWCLLGGVNDSMKDVEEIVELVGGLEPFVNLIPYNPVAGMPYRRPGIKTCERFRDALVARGIRAALRIERGQDIDAACGQLRRRQAAL